MKNLAYAALLLLAVAFAAYFGFAFYKEKHDRELTGRQAATTQAELDRHLTDTEQRAKDALAAAEQATLKARADAAALQRQLDETRAALAAAATALAAAQDDTYRAASEAARIRAEEKKIAAGALALADQHAREDSAAATARLDTLRQLLDLQQQRAAAAEKSAADANRLAAQRQVQLDEARKSLTAALARIPPPKP